MPVREIVAKTLAFGAVAVALLVSGLLVLGGPHNDLFNDLIAVSLIGLALVTVGFGFASIALIVHAARLHREAEAVHLTPRSGPPAIPPPWGMGNVGRPGGGGVGEVGGDVPSGGGSVRLMSVRTSNVDALVVCAVLIAWTVIALFLLAPR